MRLRGRHDERHAGHDHGRGRECRTRERLSTEGPAHEQRHHRVHERVRAHLRGWSHAQQPRVRREADQGRDDHHVARSRPARAARARARPRGRPRPAGGRPRAARRCRPGAACRSTGPGSRAARRGARGSTRLPMRTRSRPAPGARAPACRGRSTGPIRKRSPMNPSPSPTTALRPGRAPPVAQSRSVSQTGVVASTSAATPEGTVCSAQARNPWQPRNRSAPTPAAAAPVLPGRTRTLAQPGPAEEQRARDRRSGPPSSGRAAWPRPRSGWPGSWSPRARRGPRMPTRGANGTESSYNHSMTLYRLGRLC